MTAFFTAQQAITARLKTLWAAIPRSEPVFVENEDRGENVSVSSGYLALEVMFGQALQVSIGGGTNRFRHPGVLFVHVIVPSDAGPGEALERADLVAGIFRNTQFNGVTCRAPSISKAETGRVEGNWYMVTVSCDFFYDANF